jgi:capsular polysaccharide biosynthesis protein
VEPIREGNQALRAMVLVVVLAAVGVSTASLTQSPTYEASAHVLVGWQQEGRLETLEHWEPLSQTMTSAIDSRPVAEETIQRLQLEMTPTELLDNLTIEQVETAQFIRLTYEDTDPVRAHGSSSRSAKCSLSSSPIEAANFRPPCGRSR